MYSVGHSVKDNEWFLSYTCAIISVRLHNMTFAEANLFTKHNQTQSILFFFFD